ncbi:MAG: antibiotic biosynthesis monooxygenase [Faecalibacterium sp.]|nr:antibiotic biosynthesis monooxygenase [Faecalibacterium sp.]
MALTIHIYYRGSGGNARKFAEEMTRSGLVDRIRTRTGNLSYEYFLPLQDPETVLLIDRWTDQAALDRHHQSPMMAEILALRQKYDLHMRVERYISDEGGIPAQDRAFIKE